jgi:WD40 repeat protein
VALHPTEPLIAAATFFGRAVQVRDLHSGAVLQSVEMSAAIASVAWHPHGSLLAVSDEMDLAIHLLERSSLREVRTLRSAGRGTRLAFNRAGDRLAGYSWDNELQLFDVSTGKLLFQTPTRIPMNRPCFSRDGRRLACEAVRGRLGIWEVGGVREHRTLFHCGGAGPDDLHLGGCRAG